MSLVFAGACSHAPGITGRAARADAKLRDAFYAKLDAMRERLEATKPDALIIVAAEHFANFFMNNMPAYAIGMADHYEGPIEKRLARIAPSGARNADRRGASSIGARRYRFRLAEEGNSITHMGLCTSHAALRSALLPATSTSGPARTPLARASESGRALRRACDAQTERIELVARAESALSGDADSDEHEAWTAKFPRLPRQRSRQAHRVQHERRCSRGSRLFRILPS